MTPDCIQLGASLAVSAARSALFDEAAMQGAGDAGGGWGAGLGSIWLWLGLYVLLGTLMGGACACAAVARGLRPLPWFCAGVALNVLALGAVLTRRACTGTLPQGIPRGLGKVALTRAPCHCPGCGAANHPSAASCMTCGAALSPSVASEVRRG